MIDNSILSELFGDAEIAAHLSGEAEIKAMLQVEAALAVVEARLGVIPEAAGPAIASALDGFTLDPNELAGPTLGSGVPVPGLVKLLRERVGGEYGGYIHWGATTQDVMDTAFVLRVRTILDLLEERLKALIATLANKAEAYAEQPLAGRTRSQIATPITLGLRIANWLGPLGRCGDRLDDLRERLLVVQFGGASGNLSALGEKGIEVADALADELGLRRAAKQWHTERDTLVELGNWLSMLTGCIGRIGADLILMQRSEIAEVKAGKGGGSSTMPQKANPVAAEALVTLARTMVGHSASLQQALIHTEERDSTAWAIEWLTLPTMLEATGAALRHVNGLASSLEARPQNIERNLAIGGGVIYAEAIAFALAEQMPLGDAQTIVKQAVAEMQGAERMLIDHVNRIAVDKGFQAVKLPEASATGSDAEMIHRTLCDPSISGCRPMADRTWHVRREDDSA